MMLFTENYVYLWRTKNEDEMAAYFYEATVSSVLTNKPVLLSPGTNWLNAQNVSSLESYDANSTKVYFQDRFSGVRYNSPTPLLCTGSRTTIATALEATSSCDNDFRTFRVRKRNRQWATMTLAIKDIAFLANYPVDQPGLGDNVKVIRYNSGGTKPMWLLVYMPAEHVAGVFDSTYTGTGTGGTVYDPDEESF
jgi:hypothetical protein